MAWRFNIFRVGAGCHAGPRWQITKRPTNPSEREGTAALPYAEILCPIRTWSMSRITRMSDDFENVRAQAE